jgi:hypothetical protein
MKWAFGLFLFIWLACGLTGVWMKGDHASWKTVALGPVTLAKAFSDNPPAY